MNYDLNGNIVTLTFDDGKANAVGPEFLDNINAGLDRAQEEQAGAVILRGREGMFSGGFDLGEFKKGPEPGMAMVKRGFVMSAERIALGRCIYDVEYGYIAQPVNGADSSGVNRRLE